MAKAFSDAVNELRYTSIAFVVISTIAVGLRIYTRAVLMGRMALDDWAMILAYLFCTAESTITLTLMTLVTKLFAGHYEDVDTLITIIKAETASYILAMTFLKMSLSIFFLHIFSVHLKQQLIIYFILFVSIVFSALYLITSVATCGLKAGFAAASCTFWPAYQRIARGWSWTNAITDLIFNLIAVQALWNANMTRATRIGATFILCCGTAGGVVSLVRIIILERYRYHTGGSFVVSLHSGEWTVIETGMGITAASLACTRPLVSKIWPYLFKRSSATRAESPELRGAADGMCNGNGRFALTAKEMEQGTNNEHLGIEEKKDGLLMHSQIITT